MFWCVFIVANSLVSYADTTPLCRGDLDELQGVETGASNVDSTHAESSVAAVTEKYAVVTSFNLPPSTYATMYLRELMKQGTDMETMIRSNVG